MFTTKYKKFKNSVYSYHLSNGFIGIDFKSCPICNSNRVKETNYDYIENIPCEYDFYCEDCKEVIGHFAYGHIEPYCNVKEKKIMKYFTKLYKKEKKKVKDNEK